MSGAAFHLVERSTSAKLRYLADNGGALPAASLAPTLNDAATKLEALLSVLREIGRPKPLTYPGARLDAVRKMAREAVAEHG